MFTLHQHQQKLFEMIKVSVYVCYRFLRISGSVVVVVVFMYAVSLSHELVTFKTVMEPTDTRNTGTRR